MIKKPLAYTLWGVLLLIFFILFKAYAHQPTFQETGNTDDIILDDSRSIKNLSKSITFKTISNPDYEKFNYEEFEKFLSWLEEEYLLIFQKLEKRYIGKSLLLKWQGNNNNLNPILLTGHYDVVPVDVSSDLTWIEDPFAGIIDDNYVWGRGALDDKSGVIAILEAINYLLSKNFEPERTAYFAFGYDEEIGGNRGAAKIAEFFIEEQITLEWSLDEGSFLLEDIIPGVNKPIAIINVAEKGGLTLEIVGKSKGGHSSMPPAKTAVGYLAEAIIKLEENPLPGKLDGLSLELFDNISRHMSFQRKILFANLWLFEPFINSTLSKSPSMNAVIRTTTAPTMLSASQRANVLASDAVGTINFRLHPRDNPEKVINYVKKIIDNKDLHVRQVGEARQASQVSDWNKEGFEIISKSVREIYGDIIVTPGLMVGGSDSKHYGKAAKNSYRFNPFPISNSELDGLHGINEKINQRDFVDGIRSYIRIIEYGTSS
jgi:carboxypeptidase PM20D1